MTGTWAGLGLSAAVVLGGAVLVAALESAAGAIVAGTRPSLVQPVRRVALLLVQERTSTERPDAPLRFLAPALYLSMAAVGAALLPLDRDLVAAAPSAGVVVWGAVESVVVVAVFLQGWSPNSALPLLGGYRFIAMGLSLVLISMFVLIGVALPAESLALPEIVAAQESLWNVARQPLGLPLFLLVAMGAAFWGPLNLADGPDLATGTSADSSGSRRLAWSLSRAAILTTFAAMGTTAFLGGWLGPVLPGPAWFAVKTGGLLVLLVVVGHLVGRVRPETVVRRIWTVLLPLAFLDLAQAGVVAL